jgi:hypothetical protein
MWHEQEEQRLDDEEELSECLHYASAQVEIYSLPN